jgi:hypothetical protein
MDQGYLNQLSDIEYRRLHWLATHPPRPRRLGDLPPFDGFENWFKKLKKHKEDLKIFPTYKAYKFAAIKFGLDVQPKWQPGVPADILKDFYDYNPFQSYHQVYRQFYLNSYYSVNMRMRISEISYGLIRKKTQLSFATIGRAFDFLRHYRFVRQIWRGRPNPEDPRYLHSCYELPVNLNHVLYWRINNVRTVKKDKIIKSN